ncbi:Zn-dependent hydrolase, glyoxylase [secondary endosymbiont of Heteropsylla cubana]|uniref:Zn-dependent hydrolase, glyoxylase n=1 Tax=secondary endosymbiont of Heteropsylla cubana TaxID=134287 RepID=J3YSZ0_9ENTR|nr:MBL fold metallo-hydrolase [secondary endosymbiont of Heteropsylla cubana]AFP85468.1 Zn-dependent hydrolase, glyoxylase [secondary endosymbiont of Heteropsylla cubana]
MKYHIILVTPFKQNCTLVWCEKTGDAVLIDPGGEANVLSQVVKKIGVAITEIWLTHGHLDHVGAAIELAKFYDVPIIGPHPDDEPLLAKLPEQCQMFGLDTIITPFKPTRWLMNGCRLHLGCLSFYVLHCPGHSPGHVVFWNKSKKFIFMGDVLFNGSIGRTDLPGGDLDTLIKSIRNQLLLLSNDIVFLPGHGPKSTLGYERWNNPFLQ